MVKLPDPGNQTSQLDNVGLSGIDRNSMLLPNYTGSVNLTETIKNINTTIQRFTTKTIHPDLGDWSKVLAKIEEFNTLVLGINNGFTNWTYTDVVNNYVIPRVPFSADDATGNPSAPSNGAVLAKWYNTGEVLQRVSFNYYATRQLSFMKTNVSSLCSSLFQIQDTDMQTSKT
jgi:hypothetical protein